MGNYPEEPKKGWTLYRLNCECFYKFTNFSEFDSDSEEDEVFSHGFSHEDVVRAVQRIIFLKDEYQSGRDEVLWLRINSVQNIKNLTKVTLQDGKLKGGDPKRMEKFTLELSGALGEAFSKIAVKHDFVMAWGIRDPFFGKGEGEKRRLLVDEFVRLVCIGSREKFGDNWEIEFGKEKWEVEHAALVKEFPGLEGEVVHTVEHKAWGPSWFLSLMPGVCAEKPTVNECVVCVYEGRLHDETGFVVSHQDADELMDFKFEDEECLVERETSENASGEENNEQKLQHKDVKDEQVVNDADSATTLDDEININLDIVNDMSIDDSELNIGEFYKRNFDW